MEQFSDADSQTERGIDEVMSVGSQLALPVYRPWQTLAQLEALQTPKRASPRSAIRYFNSAAFLCV